MWHGIERNGDQADDFLVARVVPRPIVPGAAWKGLKIGEDGARRFVDASADGALRESDPFDPRDNWGGSWIVPGGDLRIVVDGVEGAEPWVLEAKPSGDEDGVYVGVEHCGDERARFIVVRVG